MSDEEEKEDWSYTSHIGKDLRGVNLSGANLKRAVFDGADLEGADLSGADMRSCLLYTSPSPRDQRGARMPSSA